MNQRPPYQLYIAENSQPYPELEGLEAELLVKFPSLNIRRINRLSAIHPSTANQQTLILVLTKLLMIDNQLNLQLQQLSRNKARIVMFPVGIANDPKFQVATSRPEIVNLVGRWYGGSSMVHSSQLSNTRSLSEMGYSSHQPQSLVVTHYKSKNKNFNMLMKTLGFKYKGTPIQIKEVTDLNEVRRIVGMRVILVVCSWQANELQDLIRIVKNDPHAVTTILFVTEGGQSNPKIASLYDYSTSHIREVEYLVDSSTGRSSIRNDTSMNSQQYHSVHRSKEVITIVNPPVLQMQDQQIPNQNPPQIKQQINPQIMQSFDVPMVNTSMPTSPVRPLSSGPQPNLMYGSNADQQITEAIANNFRPQSAYLPNQQYSQMSSVPPVPGTAPPPPSLALSPPGSPNPRIQMVSAKKITRELSPRNVRQNLLVLDTGSNQSFRAFYRPIIGTPQLIQQLPKSLQFQNPTIILLPYEERSRLYQVPEQVPNLSFVLYAPRFVPDNVVMHSNVQLTTSNPEEFSTYLQRKNILPRSFRPTSATSIDNVVVGGMGPTSAEALEHPKISKVISNMGANSMQMGWISRPVGPGEFMTVPQQQGHTMPAVNRSQYANQNVVPILKNAQGYHPPALRGVSGVFGNSEVYNPQQPHGNVLDELSKLMAAGRISGLTPQPQPMFNSRVSQTFPQQQLGIVNQANNQLNQSSELEEIVINHRKSVQSIKAPSNPLVFPSGIQRQGGVSPIPSKYQVPLVIDQTNMGAMNTPMQVMPIVPQSRFSNISSDISRKQTGTFNSNIYHPGEDSLHFNASPQNTSRGYNQLPPTLPGQQRTLRDTFGPLEAPPQPMAAPNMNMLPFNNPTSVPYPGPPPMQMQPPPGMMTQPNALPVMQWFVGRDPRADQFVATSLSNMNQGNSMMRQPQMNQNPQGIQNLPISQTPPNISSRSVTANAAQGSRLSYGSNDSSINQIAQLRSETPSMQQQVHHKIQITEMVSPGGSLIPLPPSTVQQVDLQQKRMMDHQVADRLDPMIRDIQQSNQQEDFTPRDIGAMIFNMHSSNVASNMNSNSMNSVRNSNPNIYNSPIQQINVSSSSNLPVPMQQMMPSNIPASTISSQQTQLYQPYQQTVPQPSITSSQVTHKKRVITIDQGTSPIQDYFPPLRRTASPLRPYKLKEMQIQVSPERRGRDSFPTVVQPRFVNTAVTSGTNQLQPQATNRGVYLPLAQTRGTYNIDVLAPDQYGIITNRNLKSVSYDSPVAPRRIMNSASEGLLPNLQSNAVFQPDPRYSSPGRVIENKALNNKDFEVRVENGITIYSRRSARSIPEESRAKSLSFSPSTPREFQTPNLRFLNSGSQQIEYNPIRSREDIVVDLRTSNRSPQPIPLNNIIRSREDVVVDLRPNGNQAQLKITGSFPYPSDVSPLASNAGETYINSLIKPQMDSSLNMNAQRVLRSSSAYQPNQPTKTTVGPSLQNGFALNVIYPLEQIEIQSSLNKRVANVNHLRYHDRDSLFKALKQSSGQVILVVGVPYDRNIEQLRRLNPQARILVFKGNPNLVKVDERTAIVNSHAEVLGEVERKALRR